MKNLILLKESTKRPSQQEVVIVTLMTLLEIFVLFEDLPMWLFTSTHLNCNNIYLPDMDSFIHLLDIIDIFKSNKTLFNKSIQEIGQRTFEFCMSPMAHVIHLVSGSVIYLNDKLDRMKNKRYMMIILEHKFYRKLLLSNFDWKRTTHKSCGGVTTYSTLYATSEAKLVVQTTTLQCLFIIF